MSEYEPVVRTTTLNSLTAMELGWLAGLIEGEGTFFCAGRRDRRYPFVAVGMTDEDVVRKAHAISGVGKVSLVTVRGLMKKPRFVWRVTRAVDAFALAALVRPHMGIRRQAQIDKMVADSSVRHIEANL